MVATRGMPVIGVPMGDPNGIGPEVAAKAALGPLDREYVPLLIGDLWLLEKALQILHVSSEVPINVVTTPEQGEVVPGKVNILHVSAMDPLNLAPGTAAAESGRASLDYTRRGVELVLSGRIDGIACAPSNKEGMKLAGSRFSGYIIMKLTGKRTIDTSRASMTLLFDLAGRQWSQEICAREGISRELLPPLFEPWEVVGETMPEVSGLLGMETGVPVLAGCVDSVAACVGAGVIESGQALLMLGSTGRVSMSINSPDFDSKLINQCHAVPQHWICIGAMNNSGGSLKWFADCFCQLEEAIKARAGISPYELIDMAASRSVPGSRGLVYLPYLSGERSPIWNSRARGVFFGLFDGSNWSDLARSVMEGVAFSFRDNLISIEGTMGRSATKFTLVGGGARSRPWRQILCDVLERPLAVPEVIEAEIVGCIALAGYASHVWGSVQGGVAELFTKTEEVFPDPRHAEIYERRFQLYKDLYHALLPIFDKAAENL